MKITYLILAFVLFLMSSCTQSGGVAPSLTGIVSAPTAPTGLVAAPGNSVVNLSWAASVSTLTPTYTVMRSLTSGSGYANVAGCVDVAVLTCTDSSVTNGTLYYYVVTASNMIGVSGNSNEVSATPNITTNPPGAISYSNSAPNYANGIAITNNVPTLSGGGPVTSWAISPSLSAATGLNFNTSTGVISGTPTTISNPGVTYTVTATNADGSSNVNITITVSAGVAAPTISYSGTYTYQAGQTVSPPITPTLGGGTPTSCTSSPALPTGFVLNSTTCVISGTPTVTAAQQLFTITATNSGGSASGTVNIGVLSSGANNITITGVASFTTAACALFNVTSRDAFGNAAPVTANTTFNLTGAGSNGAFYSDVGCTSTATTATIPNGGSTIVFYYRKTTTGSASLTATLTTPVSPALGSANRNVTVALSTPAKFGVVIPSTGTTVSCNAVTINVLDSSDNAVNLTSSKTVSLSGTGSATFYSDAACATTASSIVIASGANTGTAYMRKTSAGSSTVTAASTGMASGTASITISIAPAQRVVFSTSAAAPYAASTCQAYVLQSRDSLGNNASAVTADTTVILSGVVDGNFYPTSSCTPGSEITTTTILSGQSTRSLWYSKPTSSASTGGNVTLTAAVSGWTPNGSTAAFGVSTGNAINLAAPGMAAAGIAVSTATAVPTIGNKCLLTTIRSQDELNTIVPVASTVTASLTGGGPGAYFSNSNCTSSTTTVTISAGSSTGSFYYSSPTTTSAVAMTWNNGGLSGVGGSRNVTVTSGVPSRLTWTANPTSYNLNTCSSVYTFNVRDPNTVTAIGTNVSSITDFQLADGSDGTFYSNSTCTNAITTVSVANAAQTASFYYRKPTAGAVTLTVSLQSPVSPAITNLTQAVNVTTPALVANNILITAAPATGLVATQSCSLLTLQARNGTTNANVSGAQSFTLNGTNGAAFYLDNGCTAVASPASLTIANGTSSISGIYTKTANTGTVTIGATGGLTVNGATLTYSAPPPTLLALTGPILMNAGSTCGNYTIETQDGAGVPRNVAANTQITAASTGSVAVQFYSDASCSTPLPSNQVTVTSGTNTANFYSQGSTPGSATIQVSGSGLTSASQSLTVQ